MAHEITDACVNCGICQAECPADAIAEGADRYVIDPVKCTDCGACVDICPAEAVKRAG